MTDQTVFLCDDDEGVRSSIAFLLRQHGLRVVSYASGADLLRMLSEGTFLPRGILILDVRMEPLSGLQVHEAIISKGLGGTHANRVPEWSRGHSHGGERDGPWGIQFRREALCR
jgi:DNA-binding NtrC family response regulator